MSEHYRDLDGCLVWVNPDKNKPDQVIATAGAVQIIKRQAIHDYLASEEAEKALAEALYRTFVEGDITTGRIFTEHDRPIAARAILQAWRERLS